MRNKILKTVTLVSKVDLLNKSRKNHFVQCRKIYYKICKDLIPKVSLSEIGSPFMYDHTTVLNSLDKFYEIENDKYYFDIYLRCLKILSNDEYPTITGQKSINLKPYYSIIQKLEKLNNKEIHDLEKFRIDPFIKMLKIEA